MQGLAVGCVIIFRWFLGHYLWFFVDGAVHQAGIIAHLVLDVEVQVTGTIAGPGLSVQADIELVARGGISQKDSIGQVGTDRGIHIFWFLSSPFL